MSTETQKSDSASESDKNTYTQENTFGDQSPGPSRKPMTSFMSTRAGALAKISDIDINELYTRYNGLYRTNVSFINVSYNISYITCFQNYDHDRLMQVA